MNRNLKNRWITLGCIWAGIFIITLSNIKLKDSILESRKEKILLQVDKGYLLENATKINATFEQAKAFYQNIDSLKLGLLSLENELTWLAQTHDLSDVKFNSTVSQADSENIPVVLSFKGFLNGLAAMLAVIKNNYAYLSVTQITVDIDKPKKEADFRISINYRFKLPSSGSEA